MSDWIKIEAGKPETLPPEMTPVFLCDGANDMWLAMRSEPYDEGWLMEPSL